MNKPAPPSGIPMASAPALAAVRQESAAERPASFQLDVRFYRVMKPFRVYPLVVKLANGPARLVGGQAPVVVRPVVGGALVTPAQRQFDPHSAGDSATFQITPQAKGRLLGACVEVSQGGRTLTTIPMKMQGKTQRLTWLLFFLTLVVPSVLLYFTSIAPLKGDVPKPSSRPSLPLMGAAGGDAPAPGARDDAPRSKTPEPRPGAPGEIVQYQISRLVHKNCPTLDFESAQWLIKENVNYVVSDKPDDAVEWVAYGVGWAYQCLCDTAHDFYPAFFCAAALGALTLLSWLSHRSLRGRMRTPAIRVSEVGAAS
ncbi:MAG TPA: hypothetical protein VGG61_09455 [Gemmataceae bacterium]